MISSDTLQTFDGPIDLLLDLIEKEELDICELSLAKVTHRYLKEASAFSQKPEILAEFLVIASKLLYLKSKAILPKEGRDEEKEEEIKDLTNRLLEYKKYKEAAERLAKIMESKIRSFKRPSVKIKVTTFAPPQGFDLDQLVHLFQGIISKMPQETEEEVITVMKITVKEKIDFIRGIIRVEERVSFSQIMGYCKSRYEMVVTFLAVLEVIKQKIVQTKQEKNFFDFVLEKI